MSVDQYAEVEFDLNKRRTAVYKNTWKNLVNTVHRCNLKVAQKKGLHFCQARSNAVVLHNTLPTICFEKGVHMKYGEEPIVQQTVSISKVTAQRRAHAEFASWTSGSFQSRSENIHRPSKQTKRGVRRKPLRRVRGDSKR